MPYKTPYKTLTLMLLALPLALSQPGGGSTTTETGTATGTATGTETDTATRSVPERLVLRLLGYPGYGDRDMTLFVGEAPEPLEGLLPALEGVVVLGGLQRGDGTATVVADATLPAGEVVRLYRERLTAEGWSVADPEAVYGRHDVFVPADEIDGLVLCRDDGELQLGVAGSGKETEVQFTLTSVTEYSACNPAARDAYFGDEGPLFDLLPPLVAPEGAQQRGGGRSGGDDEFLASNELVTELGAAALAEHYGAQLEATGWELDGERAAEDRVWKAFALRADEGQLWQVVLVVKTGAREGVQNVYLAAF